MVRFELGSAGEPFMAAVIASGIKELKASMFTDLMDRDGDISFLIFFNMRGVVESASTELPLCNCPLALRVAGNELGNRSEKQ